MSSPSSSHERDNTDDSLNKIWNVFYEVKAILNPIMASDNDKDKGVCPKSTGDSCPSGHMLVQCDSNNRYQCKQCSEKTFQPNENWIGDKCRLRQQCDKPHMKHQDHGSTVRDAKCACEDGYHFSNEDQRICLRNPECPKGTAPGTYGTCEPCIKMNMYSDEVGRMKKCKPLTNCEKQHRCTLVPSKGDADNHCGSIVKDLNTCEELNPPHSGSPELLHYAIIGGVVAILLLVVILLIYFCFRRRQLRRQYNQRALTEAEVEQLRVKVVKDCDKDPALHKKVLSTSFSFIEERIDRQIWTLAQELFRFHPKQGHYEVIVEKYKDSQAKYTVNGYLQEWKMWKGDSKDSVGELFRCLRQVKRDDIVNEICMCLRKDVDYHTDVEFQNGYHKQSLKDECTYIFFPCFYHKKEKSPSVPSGTVVVVENDGNEAGTKLLAIASDDVEDGADDGSGVVRPPPGAFYHNHPSPSAPVLEENTNNIFPSLENVKFNRQWSQPVQATS
ncbi:unnamed protein product [Lymnaea stagnalis]|uniref:Uncharacterized protein n=1 Tax=Lymnaea stagnalis TaxID=6523 RepID=A0AAV2HPS5_LYMST